MASATTNDTGRRRFRAGGSRAGQSAPPQQGRGTRVLFAILVVLGGVYALGLVILAPSSPGTSLTYSTLTRSAVCNKPTPRPATPGAATTPADASGDATGAYCHGADANIQVRSVRLLDQDARITGMAILKKGGRPQPFWTAYPKSDAATNDLLRVFVGNGIDVSVDSQNQKAVVRFLAQFLLPLVILANLFAIVFALSRSGGGVSEFLRFGRLGDKRVKKGGAGRLTFADVAGADEAIVELAEVRDYLAKPSAFEKMGALPPKGVLLAGPPGCGKTLLARAVAGESKVAFFTISGSAFVESLVGVGAARVRDLFRQARESAPAIIFIDELDAAGRQRGAGLGGGNDEREQTLNEMLVQMDGFSPAEGIVVIGATNRVDILDPALLRAGRFDRHITVDWPDLDGRLAILRLHARSRRLADPERDLASLARRTAGFTGADLANLLNEAALLAVREDQTAISTSHLEEAADRVLAGPRRRGRAVSDEDKQRIAYHEAGHAVVAAAFGRADSIDKVSVISRGRGVGHLALLAQDKSVFTRHDIEAQVAVAMAGVASEELVFGQPSTGAEADLGRATETARDMAGRFGMSPRLGRVRVLQEPHEVFLGRDYLSTRDVSQPTLEHLDGEVRRILDEQEAKAKAILGADRAVLDTLATALATQETVQGSELAGMLGRVRSHLELDGAASNGPRRRAAGTRRAGNAPPLR